MPNLCTVSHVYKFGRETYNQSRNKIADRLWVSYGTD